MAIRFPSGHWGIRTIRSYERIEQIGEGTYGQVYKAINKDTSQIVALKKIRVRDESQGLPVTAIREIKILKQLTHPHMVCLKEIVTSKGCEELDDEEEGEAERRNISAHGGNLFLVLEYAEHDLSGLLDAQYQFSELAIKTIMRQLLDVLRYIHDERFIHRDLKASNLLLNNFHELKLADFGLARSIAYDDRPGGREDLTNKVITLWYRPPELLLGETRYGPPVDMWSVGCILVELLLGKPIFFGKSEIEQVDMIFRLVGTPTRETWPGHELLPAFKSVCPAQTYPPRLREVLAGRVPSDALDLISRLLNLDPSRRASAKKALASPYFFTPPVPPDNPRELGPLQLENGASLHEFQTKKIRRAARAAREQQAQALHQFQQQQQAGDFQAWLPSGPLDVQMQMLPRNNPPDQEGWSETSSQSEPSQEDDQAERGFPRRPASETLAYHHTSTSPSRSPDNQGDAYLFPPGTEEMDEVASPGSRGKSPGRRKYPRPPMQSTTPGPPTHLQSPSHVIPPGPTNESPRSYGSTSDSPHSGFGPATDSPRFSGPTAESPRKGSRIPVSHRPFPPPRPPGNLPPPPPDFRHSGSPRSSRQRTSEGDQFYAPELSTYTPDGRPAPRGWSQRDALLRDPTMQEFVPPPPPPPPGLLLPTHVPFTAQLPLHARPPPSKGAAPPWSTTENQRRHSAGSSDSIPLPAHSSHRGAGGTSRTSFSPPSGHANMNRNSHSGKRPRDDRYSQREGSSYPAPQQGRPEDYREYGQKPQRRQYQDRNYEQSNIQRQSSDEKLAPPTATNWRAENSSGRHTQRSGREGHRSSWSESKDRDHYYQSSNRTEKWDRSYSGRDYKASSTHYHSTSRDKTRFRFDDSSRTSDTAREARPAHYQKER